MMLKKVKFGLMSLFAVGVLCWGAWHAVDASTEKSNGRPVQAISTLEVVALEDEDKAAKEGKVRKLEGVVRDLDAAAVLLTARVEDMDFDTTYAIDLNAKVTYAGKPIQAQDLKKGMEIRFTLEQDKVKMIEAIWPTIDTRIAAVDIAKRMVTIPAEDDDEEKSRDLMLPVAADATLLIGRLPSGLADFAPGQKVDLLLAADRKSVLRIEGGIPTGELPATLRKIEGTKLLVAVIVGEEEAPVDLNLELAKELTIRLEGRQVAAKELPERARLHLRLAEDRRTVTGIRAALPAPKAADEDD